MQKCVIRFARAAKLEQCKIITDIIPGGKRSVIGPSLIIFFLCKREVSLTFLFLGDHFINLFLEIIRGPKSRKQWNILECLLSRTIIKLTRLLETNKQTNKTKPRY